MPTPATITQLPKVTKKAASFFARLRHGLGSSLPGTPALHSEDGVAKYLGVSIFTLQRIRKRGEIDFIIVGGRVFYTSHQINKYLTSVSVEACKSGIKLAVTGCPDVQVQTSSTPLGSTPTPDKHDALLLAQATFGKPKSG